MLKKKILAAAAAIALSASAPAGTAPTAGSDAAPAGFSTEAACLTAAAWSEARGRPAGEITAVMHVVKNRTAHAAFAGTVCGVVLQKGQFQMKPEFRAMVVEASRSGKLRLRISDRERPAFERLSATAALVLEGQSVDPTGGATHFYTPSLRVHMGLPASPDWAARIPLTLSLGEFRFHRLAAAGRQRRTPEMDDGTILFADTETDGLWREGFGELHPGQPHPVQAAFARYDEHGRELHAGVFLISPDPAWPPLTEASMAIHGISDELRGRGLQPFTAARTLGLAIQDGGALGGHNVGYDLLVLRRFFLLLGEDTHASRLSAMPTADTMHMGIDHCRLPRRDGRPGHKRPSLTELHQFLFGEPIPNAHDALVDVRASARCYFKMRRLGVNPAPAVPPRTAGGRDRAEAAKLIGRASAAPKRGSREEEFVREQAEKIAKFGDSYLASDAVWKWLQDIAARS